MNKWEKWNRILYDVFCIIAIIVTPSFILELLWGNYYDEG
jgi:hypothetical protein|nr:MAG TPA: hypothetical protein [Caudoviricetes sp.]